MSPPPPPPPPDTAFEREGEANFFTTAWTLVRQAQDPSSAEYRRSVEELCSRYWKPVYAFVRRRGWNAEEARDLTQEYFSRFLEKELFARADRARGRFRSFVLVTVERFLRDELDKRTRRRRAHDALAAERRDEPPRPAGDPEEEFNRELARELVARVLDRMAVYCAERGQERYIQAFRLRIEGIEAEGRSLSYDQIAEELNSTVTDVTNAIHRARAIFRRLLREEIRQGVSRESEIDDEIAELRKYLA